MQPRPNLDFGGKAELEWSAFCGFTANSFEGSVTDVLSSAIKKTHHRPILLVRG